MSGDAINKQSAHEADALTAIDKLLASEAACTSEEQSELRDVFGMLRKVRQKLIDQHFEIALYGEIDVGKSAMINALLGYEAASVDVRGGWTREVWSYVWPGLKESLSGSRSVKFTILDTPGINEHAADARMAASREAARRADLVVFVTDSDLNSAEFDALTELIAAHKPIIVVLNKADLYTAAEKDSLTAALRDSRLAPLILKDNFVLTSARPKQIEYVVEDGQGGTRSEFRRPAPNVGDLLTRIKKTIESEEGHITSINASLAAVDAADQIAAAKVRLRDKAANKIITSFAVTKGVAVGVNPVPIADVLGGAAVDAGMIVALGKVYGYDLTKKNANKLAYAIAQAAGWMAVVDGVIYGLFKTATTGIGAVLTAVPQAVTGAYGSYIVGQAAKYYFEHGATWGLDGPKQIVQRILNTTDRESVLAILKAQILERLEKNPHGRK